jgi:hypothetical protein
MLDPVQDLSQSLDRLQDRGLIRPPDPAQTQAKLQAYLTTRGRAIAQDLDLDQIEDADAIELGRLDCIAELPDLDQDLAPRLAMIADTWHQGLAQDQHEIDHDLGQAHDHGRLRETGVDLDQDHTRLQLMGLDPERGHNPAPDPGELPRPSRGDPPSERALGRGRGGSRSRSGWKDRVRNEGIDPITAYLEQDQDDDHDWRPTP